MKAELFMLLRASTNGLLFGELIHCSACFFKRRRSAMAFSEADREKACASVVPAVVFPHRGFSAPAAKRAARARDETTGTSPGPHSGADHACGSTRVREQRASMATWGEISAAADAHVLERRDREIAVGIEPTEFARSRQPFPCADRHCRLSACEPSCLGPETQISPSVGGGASLCPARTCHGPPRAQ